jgi:SecD/SecF fusion protein
VFDRIRENAPRMPRATFSQIVNRSMSEVLTRSLATSFCTLLPVSALLFFGGETLKDFAFALLVGIASGTYSSIFIASPVLTAWKEREAVYVQRRHRVIEAFGMVPAFAVATTAGVPAAPAAARLDVGGPRSGNGRRDVDEPEDEVELPADVEVDYEEEPVPDGPELDEAVVDRDPLQRPVARRTNQPTRKKGSRAQRRRKGKR